MTNRSQQLPRPLPAAGSKDQIWIRLPWLLAAVICLLPLLTACDLGSANRDDERAAAVDPHAGHVHGDECQSETSAEHADEDADHADADGDNDHPGEDEDDHDDHLDESEEHADEHDHADDQIVVELMPASERLAGITLAEATTGTLHLPINIPGEVGFNEDHLAHVAPRFEGIVRKVSCYVGNRVRVGDELALIESNVSMSEYAVVAPIDGVVVDKHITTGEFVSQDSELFAIANLSTVWVNLEVPTKYAGRIQPGLEVELEGVGASLKATGKVDYVAPVLHPSTRNGQARVVLANPRGVWRPGAFVIGRTCLIAASPAVLVRREAVQVISGDQMLFVPEGKGSYRAVPVEVGLSNSEQVEILAGLESDASYVCSGAFELKAQLTVSNLSGHAGHGH